MTVVIPTPEEINEWPHIVGLEQAASAFGMARPTAYKHSRQGTFPVPTQRVGGKVCARTADIRRALGMDDPAAPKTADHGIDPDKTYRVKGSKLIALLNAELVA